MTQNNNTTKNRSFKQLNFEQLKLINVSSIEYL